MGKKKMKCPECGTSDINEMIVEFEWRSSPGVRDTTTLPKYLYYLVYPEDVGRMSTAEPEKGEPSKPKKIKCLNCSEEIEPTRFGI